MEFPCESDGYSTDRSWCMRHDDGLRARRRFGEACGDSRSSCLRRQLGEPAGCPHHDPKNNRKTAKMLQNPNQGEAVAGQ